MNAKTSFVVLALVAVMAGCNYVATEQPIGKSLEVEAAEWEGVWLNDDGSLTIRVADAEAGLLEVGWVEDKPDGFVLETIEVHLGRVGGRTFASFSGIEDTVDYPWSLLGREQDEVYLWWPRAERFQGLVEEGLLPGKVEDGDVMLGPLTAEHLALLVSEEHGMLYAWDEPMVFRRFAGR
jgi:hypothetical protein